MNKEQFEEKLIVGAKIKIGKEYSEWTERFEEGEVIILVQGWFERDNGLYIAEEDAPSIRNEDDDDFDSIYHLFGNDFEYFFDNEIL